MRPLGGCENPRWPSKQILAHGTDLSLLASVCCLWGDCWIFHILVKSGFVSGAWDFAVCSVQDGLCTYLWANSWSSSRLTQPADSVSKEDLSFFLLCPNSRTKNVATSASSRGVREPAKKGKQKRPFPSVALATAPPKEAGKYTSSGQPQTGGYPTAGPLPHPKQ